MLSVELRTEDLTAFCVSVGRDEAEVSSLSSRSDVRPSKRGSRGWLEPILVIEIDYWRTDWVRGFGNGDL